MGNDNITGGISRNEDDFRTFGLYANVFWKDYVFYADLDCYTFKDFGYRYDLLTVGAEKTFEFGDLYVLKAGLGLQLKGPMGGEFMQNTIHKIRKITPVYLDYDPAEIHFSARASVKAYMDKRFSPYIDLRTGFDWRTAAGVRLRMDEFSVATLTYSYDIYGTHGLNLAIEADNGFLVTKYETNLLDHTGYGISLFNPFKPVKGNGNTVGGAFWMTGHNYGFSMMEMRFALSEKATALLNIKFATGEVNNNASIRMEDNFYSAGIGYRVLDWLELRAFGGVHYYETRENHVISSSVKPHFGADFRLKAFEAFNVGFNLEGGVLWQEQFYLYGGISLVF